MRRAKFIGPPKPTKHQRWLVKQRQKGLRRATFWVPNHAYDDVMAQAEWLCRQRGMGMYYSPMMCVDVGSIDKKSTGRMAKSV